MKKSFMVVVLMVLCETAGAAVLYSPPIRNQSASTVVCLALNTSKKARRVKAELYDFDHTLKHEGQLILEPGKSQQVAFTSEPVTGAYCRFRVPNRKIRGYITMESSGTVTTQLIHEAR